MNNLWTSLTTIFTGKGGVLKLAITGSLLAGTIYEILDSHYNFFLTTKAGSISLTPTKETSAQTVTDEPHETEAKTTESADYGDTDISPLTQMV